VSLLALVSAKGSPGVTTTALALASTWPADRRVLLAELDPAGGDLAPRFGLHADPGVVQLGAAFRRGLNPDDVWSHTQTLAGGVSVLVGPPSADQAQAMRDIWPTLGSVLSRMGPDTDVIADCGRLAPGSPAIDVLHRAAVAILVSRPTIEGIAHLRTRVAVPLTRAPLAIVLVGEKPYSPGEVAGVVDARVLGAVAHDERAAGLLAGRPGNQASLRRSALVRSVRAISERMAAIAEGASRAGADAPTRNSLVYAGNGDGHSELSREQEAAQ
jgi:hypothetical protein